MKILAISLDTYGDQVLRQPLLSALLRDGHEVTLAIRRQYADILPFIDPRLKSLVCDLDAVLAGTDSMRSAARTALLNELRNYNADTVVVLPFNRTPFDNDVLAACTHAKRFALFDNGSGLNASTDRSVDREVLAAGIEHPVSVAEDSRECVKNLALYHAITGRTEALPRPRLGLSASVAKRATRLPALLQLKGARYVVMAGPRPLTTKALPVELAAETIVWLHAQHGLRTVLAGVEYERELLEAIDTRSREQGVSPVIYIGTNGSIGDLLALLRSAQAYVGADTGTMHFAAALDLPVAALFGGGHFPRFEPDAKQWFAITKRLLCFGCGWRCPFSTPHCISDVNPGTWFTGITQLLGGQSPGWVFEEGSASARNAAAVRVEFRRVVDMYWQRETEASVMRAAVDGAHQSILMLRSDVHRLSDELDVVERDRTLRKQAIDSLTDMLGRMETRLAEVSTDRDLRLAANKMLQEENSSLAQVARERLELVESTHIEVQCLTGELAVANAGLASRLEVIERLDRENKSLAAAAQERLEVIERLDLENRSLAAAAKERLELIESTHIELQRLTGELAVANAGLASRLEVIERLDLENKSLAAAAKERLALVESTELALQDLTKELAAVNADRAARLEAIERLDLENKALARTMNEHVDRINRLQQDLHYLNTTAGASRILLRRLRNSFGRTPS